MATDITIRLTGDETPTELSALAALINTLAGRASTSVLNIVATDTRPKQAEVPAEMAGMVSSDTLLEQEARRAAGEPTGSGGDGTGFPPFDSLGLPYDERIHSKPQTLNGDGTFRKRRGLDDATFAQVRDELLGNAAPPPPPATDAPEPPVEAAPVATATPVADAASASEAPEPPTGDTPSFATFPAFVAEINKFGKVYVELTPIAQMFGAASFPQMKDKPESWADFYEMCKAEG